MKRQVGVVPWVRVGLSTAGAAEQQVLPAHGVPCSMRLQQQEGGTFVKVATLWCCSLVSFSDACGHRRARCVGHAMPLLMVGSQQWHVLAPGAVVTAAGQPHPSFAAQQPCRPQGCAGTGRRSLPSAGNQPAVPRSCQAGPCCQVSQVCQKQATTQSCVAAPRQVWTSCPPAAVPGVCGCACCCSRQQQVVRLEKNR